MKTPPVKSVPDLLRERFSPAQWAWVEADERCRHVLAGGQYYEALAYLQFRLPRRLPKSGAKFWSE